MENDQINVIMDKEGLTQAQFAERVGIQRAQVSHLIANRNRVSLEILKKIHSAFPGINVEWLLSGEGDYGTPSSDDTRNNETVEEELGPLFANEEMNSVPIALQKDSGAREEKNQVGVVQTPLRKIVELTVFYDDGTYEFFSPRKRG